MRDPAGAITDLEWSYVNPAMARLLRADGDLVGRRLLETLPGDSSHAVLFPCYRRVIETGAPEEIEIFYDADGLRGWFRVDAVKLNGGVATLLRDITGRKEREAALEESEARFKLLADAVDDVFWIVELPRREVVYVSPAYERIWGFSRERLHRDPTAWRQNVHPDDRALADPVFDAMLAGRRESFELVYRMQSPDGTLRWVRDKARLVRAGEVQRVVTRELDHRLRNTFTLMQSIVRLSGPVVRPPTRRGFGPDACRAGPRRRVPWRGQACLPGGDLHDAATDIGASDRE